MQTKTKYVFMYTELQKAVKEHYGVDVRVLDTIPDERIGHYTYHEFTVDGDSELDLMFDDVIVERWIETGDLNPDMSDIEDYWNQYGQVEAQHMLHRLFKDGHIPAGEYLMKVDW